MKQQLIQYAKAGYPGLFLVSHEEGRVEAELKAVAGEVGFALHVWSTTGGLADTSSGAQRDTPDPLGALEQIESLPERSIVLFHDLSLFLEDGNPTLIRKLKDALRLAKTSARMLVLLAPQQKLPELERDLVAVEFALPDKAELSAVLDGILDSAEIEGIPDELRERALDAAAGLTTVEAENAYALCLVEVGAVDPAVIAREKAGTLKAGGLLEVVDTPETLEHIGGLDQIKDWLGRRRDAFGQAARDYGLPAPEGLLILGIPGTGKSLTAKATASAFGLPLLKLDAGKLFGGLVGQSEANLRSAVGTAEAVAPCVLWIDEIEKGFAGASSSGSTDGGTSARVFGGFLNWMQEKTAPVFVVATANDVSGLPPEFLRKGRFDELFFVDLPDGKERAAIWDIVVTKYGRDPGDYDTVRMAKATEAFTGLELLASTLPKSFDAPVVEPANFIPEPWFAAYRDELRRRLRHLPADYEYSMHKLAREIFPVCERIAVWCGRGASHVEVEALWLELCMHTLRGLALSVAGLAWHVLGFDPGCPRAEALRVLEYLRDKGSMTKADLLRRAHLNKELRDTLVERFANEGLVRVDGKTVTATGYHEFVAGLYAREELPQPVDLWSEVAREGESAA